MRGSSSSHSPATANHTSALYLDSMHSAPAAPAAAHSHQRAAPCGGARTAPNSAHSSSPTGSSCRVLWLAMMPRSPWYATSAVSTTLTKARSGVVTARAMRHTHSSMPATLSWAARKVTHTWRPSSSVQKTIHQVGAGGCL